MEKLTIKLEPSTLNVLKNFATINPMLLLRKGSTLKTRSPASTLAARANLKQAIPRDFAILDLARFLDTVSLFQDPEITLDASFCTIKQKGTSVRYLYADGHVIRQKDADREIKLPSEYFSFKLNAADYTALRKGMSVLGLPAIAIVGDGQKLSLQALDTHCKSSDVFNLVVGGTKKTFKAVIRAENLKIVPQDYQVLISDKIAYLKSIDGSMEYWICLSAQESEFGTD